MIKGIGVDMTNISEICQLMNFGDAKKTPTGEVDFGSLDPFVRHVFSEEEIKTAFSRPVPEEFLAGCFAVKEATAKAFSAYADSGQDLRSVCTHRDESGAPHIVLNDAVKAALARAGAQEIFVSIANEGAFAIAFVVVE